MPDKYGQLAPGEKEEGLEEGDLYDYIAPFTSGLKKLGRGIIGKLIKRGYKKLSPHEAKLRDQQKVDAHYSSTEKNRGVRPRYETTKYKVTEEWKKPEPKDVWEEL